MRIPLSKPEIGEREIEIVTQALRTGRLSQGPLLAEFERKFAAYVGTRYAVAASSGTAALHLCVRALGIGAGDEVLTTSFSFVASVNCLLYERAMPAFVDIDPATLNLAPEEIRKALRRDYIWDRTQSAQVNRRTGRVLKAILPVHIFGLPCDMEKIFEIAEEFDLWVLEDACEALGAEYRGHPLGTRGDAAVFAFYPNKQMTTAEGGMIVTNNPQIARVCRSLRNQGRDEYGGWLRHERLGYNYRLSELHCALGLAQLERIEELLEARARVAALYGRFLSEVPRILLPCDSPETKRSWFAYVIRLQGHAGAALRDSLMAGLRERGIGCQAYFPAIHRQPYFREFAKEPQRPLPLAESAAERCLALPLFPAMTREQVEEVCAAVREILSRQENWAAQRDEKEKRSEAHGAREESRASANAVDRAHDSNAAISL
ncbi:MAG: DegT/DnrJ/EryC1/StrS family aminotransferase [Candidatus Acidiferrales bacterium]